VARRRCWAPRGPPWSSREAQRLARQGGVAPAQAVGAAAPTEAHSVKVDSFTLNRPRTVGVEAVALWAMRQVEFVGLLARLGLSGPHRAAVLGVIVGRLAAPGSELATQRWLRERSALGELLDVDFEAMSLMQLYRASDMLMRHRAVLEEALFTRLSDRFGLDWTVTLYDLTNTDCEGEAPLNSKARHGHAKEKRSDCPLLTLGLVLDGSGFVRRSQVFEGNVVEGTTLGTMLAGLGAPPGALVVMDRGIAAKDNVLWLRARLPLPGGQPRAPPPVRPQPSHRSAHRRWGVRLGAACPRYRGPGGAPVLLFRTAGAQGRRYRRALRPTLRGGPASPGRGIYPTAYHQAHRQALGAHRVAEGKEPRRRPALPHRGRPRCQR
jgi:hypothetical protein